MNFFLDCHFYFFRNFEVGLDLLSRNIYPFTSFHLPSFSALLSRNSVDEEEEEPFWILRFCFLFLRLQLLCLPCCYCFWCSCLISQLLVLLLLQSNEEPPSVSLSTVILLWLQSLSVIAPTFLVKFDLIICYSASGVSLSFTSLDLSPWDYFKLGTSKNLGFVEFHQFRRNLHRKLKALGEIEVDQRHTCSSFF